MSILNIFKPDSNFTIGSNTQRTEPFTAGGLLLRDPNKTINIAPKDFVPGINLNPEAQAKIAAEKEAAFKKETEPKEETNRLFR